MEFDEVLALRKSVRRYTKEIVSQEDEKPYLARHGFIRGKT